MQFTCNNSTLWLTDDFSKCSLNVYLLTDFIFIFLFLSIILVTCTVLFSLYNKNKKKSFPPLTPQTYLDSEYSDTPNNDSNQIQNPNALISSSNKNDVTSASFGVASLSQIYPTTVTIVKPKYDHIRIAAELILVLILFIFSTVVTVLINKHNNNNNDNDIQVLITATIFSAYLLLLVSLRLFLPRSPVISTLWYHSTFLYFAYFIISVLSFRSTVLNWNDDSSYLSLPLYRAYETTKFLTLFLLVFNAFSARIGDKPVVLEHRKNLRPSRFATSSVFSRIFFFWIDDLIFKGFRSEISLQDVYDLRDQDHAVYILDAFRSLPKVASLTWKLIYFFKKELAISAMWATLYSFFSFGPSLIMKAILEYVDDPTSQPRNVAWAYAVLFFFFAASESICNGQALFIGRTICIRLRAIIIGEVYAKALRRRISPNTDISNPSPNTEDNNISDSTELSNNASGNSVNTNSNNSTDSNSKADKEKEKDSTQANYGAIINLMAVDAFKVGEISAYLHYFVGGTIMLIVSMVLLHSLLGWSFLAGIATIILILPINYAFSIKFGKIQKDLMSATDRRIYITNEVLQSIRVIKYFAWEELFASEVSAARLAEWKILRRRYILWSVSAAVWFGSPLIITLATFASYTLIAGHTLTTPIAFTALSIFNILRGPLDQLSDMLTNVIQSKVSIDRVDEFLAEEETPKYEQLNAVPRGPNSPIIGFENASFGWNSNPNSSGHNFKLRDINISFHIGKLNIIVGPTGSGKTSLLLALLGEMNLYSGAVYLPGGTSRQELTPDPATGLTESVAYCSQQPWLLNDTIKNNILFAADYDEKRYNAVVEACSLSRDFEILENGDGTEVGEKGIALSGGQKQRISLARALYSSARHLLLDDCLSAVDSHTALSIYNNCICGLLMLDRTCILVSHNIALTIQGASLVVVLKNGRVTAQGNPTELVNSGQLGDDDLLKSSVDPSVISSRVESRANLKILSAELYEENIKNTQRSVTEQGDAGNSTTTNANNAPISAKAPSSKGNLIQEETYQHGAVSKKVYTEYLTAMGSWYFWAVVTIFFASQQLGSILQSWWIRAWALGMSDIVHTTFLNTGKYLSVFTAGMPHLNSLSAFSFWQNTQFIWFHSLGIWAKGSISDDTNKTIINSTNTTLLSSSDYSTTFTDNFSDVTKKNIYYLSVYFAITIIYMFISSIREWVVFWGSLRASKILFDKLFYSVLYAKVRFFDSTPLGRIMNRFSKDVETIDQEVAGVALALFHSLLAVVAVIILITAITPQFLVAAIFISLLYYFIGVLYLRTSRDLKRFESITKSPIYQHFGETLIGVSTIRAYGDESRFVRENFSNIDGNNRPFFYLWVANRWLSVRVDLAGALVSFFSAVFIILSIGRLDSGLAGLALTYAVTFSENILWVVRLSSQNEINMNSVERLAEYLDIDTEAEAAGVGESGINQVGHPPIDWPSNGYIKVDNLSLRYSPDLPLVIKNVSFEVKSCAKIGVVGRTGAGKSTIITAFFRFLEAETGKIVIDGIDISKISLHDLRSKLSIIPQDPTLFTGTIRFNLDPYSYYSDTEIYETLRRVHLIDEDYESRIRERDLELSGAGAVPVQHQNPISENNNTNQEEEDDDDGMSENDEENENKNVFYDLDYQIAEGGSNLSQGQRQLMCLARSLLKLPKVIMLDEATASIDYETDSQIQKTIREEFAETTIITIAHRLISIIDYDMILVLDAGQVAEYDQPYKLLTRKKSIFKSMCEDSGQFETLFEMAKAAYSQTNKSKLSHTV